MTGVQTCALPICTIELSLANVEAGGKPFACIVVDRETREVVVEATNQVAQSGDVTAHAEVMALRAMAADVIASSTGIDSLPKPAAGCG